MGRQMYWKGNLYLLFRSDFLNVDNVFSTTQVSINWFFFVLQTAVTFYENLAMSGTKRKPIFFLLYLITM